MDDDSDEAPDDFLFGSIGGTPRATPIPRAQGVCSPPISLPSSSRPRQPTSLHAQRPPYSDQGLYGGDPIRQQPMVPFSDESDDSLDGDPHRLVASNSVDVIYDPVNPTPSHRYFKPIAQVLQPPFHICFNSILILVFFVFVFYTKYSCNGLHGVRSMHMGFVLGIWS
jgi:hypothetical protein